MYRVFIFYASIYLLLYTFEAYFEILMRESDINQYALL